MFGNERGNPRGYTRGIIIAIDSWRTTREVRHAGAVEVLFPRWWTRMNLWFLFTLFLRLRFLVHKCEMQTQENEKVSISCVCVYICIEVVHTCTSLSLHLYLRVNQALERKESIFSEWELGRRP